MTIANTNTKEQILAFFEEQKTTIAPARNRYTSQVKTNYDWSVMNNDGICLNIPMNYEDFGGLKGYLTPAATTAPSSSESENQNNNSDSQNSNENEEEQEQEQEPNDNTEDNE